MVQVHNTRTDRNISTFDPQRKTSVRIYDRQVDFSRGVQTMQRKGWILREFHEARSPQAMDLIHASIPGMVPSEARPQIVAHFVCSNSRTFRQPDRLFRRSLSRTLRRVAEWIDRPAASEETCDPCVNPA